MVSSHVRIIGDIHGRIRPRMSRADRDKERKFLPVVWRDPRFRGRSYLGLASDSTYSIQVGDLGSDYTDLRQLEPNHHRAIAGNHDNIPKLTKHFLGDFGVHSFPLDQDEFSFFFLRGAASIDRDYRVEGLNWWYEEELADQALEDAFAAYKQFQPKIMISHDCPTELLPVVGTMKREIPTSKTNQCLQRMFESHPPQWWFFGHHHKNYVFQHPRGTRFVCVGSMSYFDFDKSGKSIYTHPQ